ncbi:hypothetical protein DYE20_17005 [[Mycobacterium] chelonae subsp. gwanakae]|nr:hypothetical protein DYE20_17005 [[Mycobacterium] chelonae subsp. gwanakae]
MQTPPPLGQVEVERYVRGHRDGLEFLARPVRRAAEWPRGPVGRRDHPGGRCGRHRRPRHRGLPRGHDGKTHDVALRPDGDDANHQPQHNRAQKRRKDYPGRSTRWSRLWVVQWHTVSRPLRLDVAGVAAPGLHGVI